MKSYQILAVEKNTMDRGKKTWLISERKQVVKREKTIEPIYEKDGECIERK